jgi:Holliday junction resolvasome RuvABC DNA-binding subunit
VSTKPGQLQSLASARHEAWLALTGLGFNKNEASRAIAAALDEEPESLEQLIRAALRHCPKPTG